MPQNPDKGRTQQRQGKLQIGDQWNAINIIAQSQTHPLKAVCELVENAIDAGATEVQITRRRSEGKQYLEIADNGSGIPRDDSGMPDFARMATHICDSMKRHFSASQRRGVHGEFGIGLLSFWSLGDRLNIQSRDSDGDLHEMTMSRGKPTYRVNDVSGGKHAAGGTTVIVGPLLAATRNVVTGDKLQRYLAVELRDRIRNSGVQISVHDRIARKQFDVVPRVFGGERLDEAKNVPTRACDLKVELYLGEAASSTEGKISICKDGTRVLSDICDLPQLRHSPWNDSRLVGVLDFEALNLAPGTRSGIVPDKTFSLFLEAVAEIEPVVIDAINARDRADSEKANRRMLQQLQRAFVDALQTMPDNEYLFIDFPGATRSTAKAGLKQKQGKHVAPCGLPVPRSVIDGPDEDIETPETPLVAGPMKTATILPRNARVLPGDWCKLRVIPRDRHGVSVRRDIKVRWKVLKGKAELSDADKPTCEVFSRHEGPITLEVACRSGRSLTKDRVEVTFTKDAPDTQTGRPKGLPGYRCEAAKGFAWRSRYDVRRNEIVINSAHRDYINSRSKAARHRRYIGKLYAKEVVLMNFPHESAEGAMERLVEILMRTEEALS